MLPCFANDASPVWSTVRRTFPSILRPMWTICEYLYRIPFWMWTTMPWREPCRVPCSSSSEIFPRKTMVSSSIVTPACPARARWPRLPSVCAALVTSHKPSDCAFHADLKLFFEGRKSISPQHCIPSFQAVESPNTITAKGHAARATLTSLGVMSSRKRTSRSDNGSSFCTRCKSFRSFPTRGGSGLTAFHKPLHSS
jgi:hypothetical protein